jgi:8-oxo-dGTP diphosphatase
MPLSRVCKVACRDGIIGMTPSKRKGSSIIFVNSLQQVLLFLRDDTPAIPYPNMWDVPGGHVESGETPEECIVREIKEEIGVDLSDFQLFSAIEFSDRIEYTFWKKADLNIERIHLTEGQCLKWFSAEEVSRIKLPYGFNQILGDFFVEAPFML